MWKKKNKVQWNNQKGITAADVLIGLLIIMTTFGVIAMIYVNFVIGTKGMDRKTGATRIATNILENMNMIYYDDIENSLQDFVNKGVLIKNDNSYSVQEDSSVKVFETTIPKGYALQITLENGYEPQDKLQLDLLKKVSVKVEYLLDGKLENVELSKVFEREIVRECNSPNFGEEYVRQMIPDAEYEMYSEAANALPTGIKIICPLQYDGFSKKYKIVEDIHSLWYSYSNKQWATVLVLESNQLDEYFNLESKTIEPEKLLNNENAYVWIPRFGRLTQTPNFGGIRFLYKDTKRVIVSSYQENGNFLYDFPKEEYNINYFSTEQLGEWIKIQEIETLATPANLLNDSQFGPFLEY